MASPTQIRRPWWRQPLLHFLLAGALIFGWFDLRGAAPLQRQERITVSVSEVEKLAGLWQQTWGRAPSATELEGLVRDFIAEEIYYREAVALGLDVNDPIVRRRMRQKMEFLASETRGAATPSDADLRAYYTAHPDRYTEGASFSFEQVRFDEREAPQAETALALLRAGTPPEGIGTPVSLPVSMQNASADEIESTFGRLFAEALDRLEPGNWQGPVRSGFGLHLVKVSEHRPATIADYEAVKARIRADWTSETSRKSREEAFARLRKKYKVTVELPEQ